MCLPFLSPSSTQQHLSCKRLSSLRNDALQHPALHGLTQVPLFSALHHHISNHTSIQHNSEECLQISRLLQLSQTGLDLHFSSPYSLWAAGHPCCHSLHLIVAGLKIASWSQRGCSTLPRRLEPSPSRERKAGASPALRKQETSLGKLPRRRMVLCHQLPICLPGRLCSSLFFKNKGFVLQSHAWKRQPFSSFFWPPPPPFFF